ncbi:hypothetical protein DIPPA_10839 [Diplonema papillatum]|nr:hypothetical protein DIPPA_10839 [Diplonema papillatum]
MYLRLFVVAVVATAGWAVVDWRATNGDVFFAFLLLISLCVGFCFWMCGISRCPASCDILLSLNSGRHPTSLTRTAFSLRICVYAPVSYDLSS